MAKAKSKPRLQIAFFDPVHLVRFFHRLVQNSQEPVYLVREMDPNFAVHAVGTQAALYAVTEVGPQAIKGVNLDTLVVNHGFIRLNDKWAFSHDNALSYFETSANNITYTVMGAGVNNEPILIPFPLNHVFSCLHQAGYTGCSIINRGGVRIIDVPNPTARRPWSFRVGGPPPKGPVKI